MNLAFPLGGGSTTVQPAAFGRFLGVWLDWKLSWKAHCSAVDRKLRTQDFALSRIAAKTWGPSRARARELYTKCIRSAIAYGASSFHTPTEADGKPKGIAKTLSKAQNRSLRIVAGAYKAAPVRCLETETWVPPLDLYLNKRRADFERRLEQPMLQSGQGPEAPKRTAGTLVTEACNRVYRRFRRKRRGPGRKPKPCPQPPTATEQAAATTARWASARQEATKKLDTNQVVKLAWKARWNQQREGRPTTRLADDDPPNLLFTSKALKKHEGLTKAQSSLLTQARTGDIGLRDFLFRVKVPEVATPYCECGKGRETVEHLVVWCSEPPKPRTWEPYEIRSRRDLQLVLQGAGTDNTRLARKVLNWLMDCGRLQQYRLARRLALEQADG